MQNLGAMIDRAKAGDEEAVQQLFDSLLHMHEATVVRRSCLSQVPSSTPKKGVFLFSPLSLSPPSPEPPLVSTKERAKKGAQLGDLY
jgi:hypothetical protein